MVWNKLYISQFKGVFKTLLPTTERSLSVILCRGNTHCATGISRIEQQRGIGMLRNAEVSSGLHCNVIYSEGNKKKLKYITISLQ